MQKKILGVFFIVLLLGIIGILYSFFNYADSQTIEIKKYLSPIQKENKKLSLNKLWIDSLAKSSSMKYSYPVNELSMQIDLHKYIPPKTKSYKLIIKNIDRYSVFCVIQTLSHFNIPFVLSKNKTVPSVYIGSDSDEKLKKIVKKLKDYEIKSKIIEEWK